MRRPTSPRGRVWWPPRWGSRWPTRNRAVSSRRGRPTSSPSWDAGRGPGHGGGMARGRYIPVRGPTTRPCGTWLMRRAASITISNVLGPLVNPAHLTFQLMGVWDQAAGHDRRGDGAAGAQAGTGRARLGPGRDRRPRADPRAQATPRESRPMVTPEDLGVPTYGWPTCWAGSRPTTPACCARPSRVRSRPAHRRHRRQRRGPAVA